MNGFDTLIYEKQDGVAWLTLNRPEFHNAVNLRMRDELWMALEAVNIDPDVNVIVLKGGGDLAFSSGADIGDFGSAPSYIEARRGRQERDIFGRLLATEKPLIAAIQGYALGGGLEIALCCDLRLASEDARLGLPESRLAYIPSAGGTQTLPRLIGPGRALDLILSGDPVSADEALAMGLVQWVVPRPQLEAQAGELARRLLARPQAALRLAKTAVRLGLDLPLAEGLRLEARLRARLAGGPLAV